MQSAAEGLKEKGMRLTRQRQILLDLLNKSGQHLDAETLYKLAREKDPRLNRVTVYRTLKLLKESGMVDELDLMHFAGEQHFYETRMKQEHAHVVCLRCGKIEEYFGEALARVRQQIQDTFAFEVVIARTEMGGYCQNCRILRAQEMAEAARPAAPVGKSA
jgi:Fur family transcriptional regulator, ferric uptake regulator